MTATEITIPPGRHDAPQGPPTLTSGELMAAQRETLRTPRMRYGRLARMMFAPVDLVYGRQGSFTKFAMLEIIARVPYQAWENVAYVAMTHTAREPGLARRIFDKVRVSRFEQDNEQWHLLILEEMVDRRPERLGFVRHRIVPQVLAFAYYQLSWLMYALRPSWSYRLNADFEDHAEHEYALLVREHPEWEDVPYEGSFIDDYGRFDSLADLFRQIGYDERLHKLESEGRMSDPRFS